jgi:hypothetical protein
MSNITLAIDSELLRKSREAARRDGTTLNDLIRQFLSEITDESQNEWHEHYHAVTAQIEGNSGGWKFNREELNER